MAEALRAAFLRLQQQQQRESRREKRGERVLFSLAAAARCCCFRFVPPPPLPLIPGDSAFPYFYFYYCRCTHPQLVCLVPFPFILFSSEAFPKKQFYWCVFFFLFLFFDELSSFFSLRWGKTKRVKKLVLLISFVSPPFKTVEEDLFEHYERDWSLVDVESWVGVVGCPLSLSSRLTRSREKTFLRSHQLFFSLSVQFFVPRFPFCFVP